MNVNVLKKIQKLDIFFSDEKIVINTFIHFNMKCIKINLNNKNIYWVQSWIFKQREIN